MNKKIIYLVVAIVLLGVLSILYFYGANRHKTVEITENEAAAEENSGIAITDIKNADEIEIKNSLSHYTVYTNDEEYFVKGYEKNSFSQSNIKYLFSAFSNLRAVKSVEENAADMAKYGLETPLATAFVKGDSSITVYIGEATPDGKYVYAGTDSDKNVYMITKSYGELLLRNMTDLIEQNVTAISAENVNYVDIVEKGKPEILITADENNETLKSYVSSSGLSALMMKSPVEDAIVYPTNMQDTILCDLSTMYINSVVELSPVDLSKYGLNDPIKTITIKDTGSKSLTIKIGNAYDKDSVYVMLDDKPEVYTITNSSLIAFNDINIMDFVQNFVSLYARSEVDSVIVRAENSEHKIEFKTEGDSKIAVDEEGVKRDNRNSYIDGKLIDKDTFGDFYEALVGIGFDSIDFNNTENISGEPLVIIEFNLIDGSKNTVNYYNYNDNFYCIKNDGDLVVRLVNKQQISQLVKYIVGLTK